MDSNIQGVKLNWTTDCSVGQQDEFVNLHFDSASGAMLGFITKKLLSSSVDRAFNHPIKIPVKFTLLFLSSAALESSTEYHKGDAFTVSYLQKSCGLTVADANHISKTLHIKSTQKPDRVLDYFKHCGFTDAQISSIVKFTPTALLSDPDKTLKPRLDLLTSLGASPDTVSLIISRCPGILRMSLENKIIPSLDCIKKVVGSNEEVLKLLTRFRWILLVNPASSLLQNAAMLENIGMPKSFISRFLMTNGSALLAPTDRFKEMADRALNMGFSPNKHSFGDAINSFAALSQEIWELKFKIFKKWGWSDSDFVMAFGKQPRIMLISGKKIDGIMNLLVNTMELKASFAAECPYLFLYSLEKRIIPRCAVVKLLVTKGLIQLEDYNMGYVLRCKDEYFLRTFVEKHHEIRSELMMALYSSDKKVG
ncbi:unnamed protein product [Rhodiola kirilowii]